MTEIEVWKLISDVKDGVAHRDDVRIVLGLFVNQRLTSAAVSESLLDFVAAAFESYLSGDCSIEQALGLARKKAGKPSNVTESRGVAIAAEVLKELLKGRNLDTAADRAGKTMKIGSSQARAHWAANKIIAVAKVRLERSAKRVPWTKTEIANFERLGLDRHTIWGKLDALRARPS